MSDRGSERRGRHSSVAGAPAEEVLQDLVGQFADPYAFVRELVQNSLDAGAMGIDVDMSWDQGLWIIEVVDDGEGMDRATIEGYLLTLFRSTKEEDRTKIGKFGIGFVSLFAMEPERVVVDTGRDGLWHRVIFDEQRAFTLIEQPDPFEGTTVRLEIRCDEVEASRRAELVRASAQRWCRFAESRIRVRRTVGGRDWHTLHAEVAFPDAPVSIAVDEDGLQAALAPTRGAYGVFLGQGLVLWEGKTELLPGVQFIARSRLLEHTLTRDDVKRDEGFAHVTRRLREVATEALGEAVHAALAEAAVAGDVERCSAIGATLMPSAPWAWQRDRPLLPAVGRTPVRLSELGTWGRWIRRVVGAREAPLLVGQPDDPIAKALAGKGQIVLAGGPGDGHVNWVSLLLSRGVVDVRQHYIMPVRASHDGPLLDKVQHAAELLGHPVTVHAASFEEAGGSLKGRLAVLQQHPFEFTEISEGGESHDARHLLVDVGHPVVVAAASAPLEAAALLVAHAALASAGVATFVHPKLVTDALGAA